MIVKKPADTLTKLNVNAFFIPYLHIGSLIGTNHVTEVCKDISSNRTKHK